VDGHNSPLDGHCSAIGVEFDAGQVSTTILRNFKQCRAVTRARINGRVGCGGHEQDADVSGFFGSKGQKPSLMRPAFAYFLPWICATHAVVQGITLPFGKVRFPNNKA